MPDNVMTEIQNLQGEAKEKAHDILMAWATNQKRSR